MNEADIIIDAGYSKPVTALTMSGKDDLIKNLKLHYYTLLRSLAEVNQLKNGLAVHDIADAMVKHADIMSPLFLAASTKTLTAGKLLVYVQRTSELHIGGKQFVHCASVVRILEAPLLELTSWIASVSNFLLNYSIDHSM